MSDDRLKETPGDDDARTCDRRDFLRKLIAAGVGIPAALTLSGGILGCDGDGILTPPNGIVGPGPGPAPQGLAAAVQAGLAELNAIFAEMQAASPNITEAMREGWLARVNALAAQVWNAAADASAAEIQAAVHPDMADYDARLHEWEVDYDFSGAAPQWTMETLDGAIARAIAILDAHPGSDLRALFIFVVIGCAIYSSWTDDDIYYTALAAAEEDTEGKAGQLLDMVVTSIQSQTASEMSPACFELFFEPAAVGIEFLKSIGLYWLWALMCQISSDLALFLAFLLGLVLLMCIAPGPAEDMLRDFPVG